MTRKGAKTVRSSSAHQLRHARGRRRPRVLEILGPRAGELLSEWVAALNGKVKLSLGLAKGKRKYDKREAIKRRDEKRDLDRARKQYM